MNDQDTKDLVVAEGEIVTDNEVSDEVIDAAVNEINQLRDKTLYNGSLEIGEYVLKYIFKDDIELATSKDPHKSVSFSSLCKRQDLKVKSYILAQMVKVAAQERFFIEKGIDSSNMQYSSKTQLTKLPNDDAKIELARKAIEDQMKFRELRLEVSSIVGNTTDKKHQTRIVQTTKKYLNKIEMLNTELNSKHLEITADELKGFKSPKRLQKLKEQVDELEIQAEQIANEFMSVFSKCKNIKNALKTIDISQKQKTKKEKKVKNKGISENKSSDSKESKIQSDSSTIDKNANDKQVKGNTLKIPAPVSKRRRSKKGNKPETKEELKKSNAKLDEAL